MILREKYYQIIQNYFSFLEDDFNYQISLINKKNTLLYDIEYSDKERIISISYEIMGEGINIVIFKLINGKKSDYDDEKNTLHLNKLFKEISKEKLEKYMNSNVRYFKKYGLTILDIEKEALKKAKKLRLFLICE